MLARIERHLEPSGLRPRGGFHPQAGDGVPGLRDGGRPASVVLIGNIGRTDGDPMWRAFAAARGRHRGSGPLDHWTREIVDAAARALGAETLYPFGGPPYLPFQRWAMRAEPVALSPLGLLIHPEYGLWHAYRAALLFAARIDLPPRGHAKSPCESCAAKPCLSACPVDAFGPKGYDVPRCAAFLATDAGEDCMGNGCRARRACPVGASCAHAPAQARFHMQAFLRARRAD